MTWANNSSSSVNLQFDTKFLAFFALHWSKNICVCAWRINNEDHAAAWNEVHESDDDALAQFSHIFHLHFISYLFRLNHNLYAPVLTWNFTRIHISIEMRRDEVGREQKKLWKSLTFVHWKWWETMEVGGGVEFNKNEDSIFENCTHIHELHDKWKAQSLFRHTQKTFPRFTDKGRRNDKKYFPIEYSVCLVKSEQEKIIIWLPSVNTMWSHQIHIKRDVLTWKTQ